MKEKKKKEKIGFNTHKKIKRNWHAPNTARKGTVGEKTKGTTTSKSWTVTSSKHQLETIARTAEIKIPLETEKQGWSRTPGTKTATATK